MSIYEGVELEDYVFCGPSIVFTNVKLPRSEFPQRGTEHYSKTLVKKSASIGANATIVCGVTIGEYALNWCRCSCHKRCPSIFISYWQSS